MNLADIDLRQAAREHLIANGLDPDVPQERARFSLAEHMVASALYLLDAHVPTVFQGVEPDEPDVQAWTRRFLTDPKSCPSLLLIGPTGAGKSHQAFGALRHIVLGMARGCRRLQWQTATFAAFNAAVRPRADEAHLQALDEFQTVDLLLLDDLGAGMSTNWTDDNLYRLIDYRWSHRLPTIVTTNLDGDDLAAAFDERVVSRLNAAVEVILTGPDRRLGGVA